MASSLEVTLALQLRALRAPEPIIEYRFAAHHVGGPGKGLRERLRAARLQDWRFDLAWPALMFAVEIEGGAWTGGRHTRGKGFEADLVKYGAAQLLGWTIYRCGSALVKSGGAAQTIVRLLEMQQRQRGNAA